MKKKQALSIVKEILNLKAGEDSEIFLQKIDDLIECISDKNIYLLYEAEDLEL